MLYFLVIFETNLSKKVESKHGEHHNPDCKIDLPVENAPAIGLVGYRKEFESESYLYESEDYLY